MKKLKYIFLLSIIFTLNSCEKQIIPDTVKGKVVYPGVDGCRWMIQLDDGSYLEAVNWEAYRLDQYAGQTVKVKYVEKPTISICMMGTTVELKSLKVK